MRNTKKTVLVVLLILLVEVLYLQVDPISFGLPFRSIEYRTEISESFIGEDLPLGLSVEPVLLICDILIAFILALILIQCVPQFIIVLLLQGCVLGLLIGPIACWCAETLSEPLISFIMIPLLFVLTPLIIYILSLRNQRQKTAIVIVSFMAATTVCFTVFLIGALFDGVDEGVYNLRLIPRLLAFTAVPVFECFILMLLHKKVLPMVLRNKRLQSPSEMMVDKAVPVIVSEAEKANRKNTLKRAILYASLLVIPAYTGHHFMTIRKMYNDELFIFQVIESKLERLNIIPYQRLEIPDEHSEIPVRIGSWSMDLETESFDAGWNASFTTEVKVDDEKLYTKVRKHFFVPWLQVDIHKIENTE